MFLKKSFVYYFLLSLCSLSFAQDTGSGKFDEEVKVLTAQDASINKKKLILFTGSSSIRRWKDIHTYFPQHNILNRGFGGSQMNDLVDYFDKLILPYQATQIFIYEGDNDINAGKTTAEILLKADELLQLIRTKLPDKTKIIFIGIKPSLSRWKLKAEYQAFNAAYEDWTKKNNVGYVDMWSPMLDSDGNPINDVFIEDGLHLNKKGYDIWGRVLVPYVGK